MEQTDYQLKLVTLDDTHTIKPHYCGRRAWLVANLEEADERDCTVFALVEEDPIHPSSQAISGVPAAMSWATRMVERHTGGEHQVVGGWVETEPGLFRPREVRKVGHEVTVYVGRVAHPFGLLGRGECITLEFKLRDEDEILVGPPDEDGLSWVVPVRQVTGVARRRDASVVLESNEPSVTG